MNIDRDRAYYSRDHVVFLTTGEQASALASLLFELRGGRCDVSLPINYREALIALQKETFG
jgi:hypothetical protein